MKRRTFLASIGFGCAVPSSFLNAEALNNAISNRDLHYIDPRLEKIYEKEFGGKTVLEKNSLTDRNILLITSDQHHYMCMGYNNPQIKTPNLDRLAKMGIIFDRAYCNNPTSTPTRASIITGKYASQHGAWSLGTKLPENELTVGDCFQKAGYRTALIGKAHFQPTKFYAKSYIDEQYKLTIYMNQTYGELFDLINDPKELKNLWDVPEAKELKSNLLLKMLHAELEKEPLFMPRIAPA